MGLLGSIVDYSNPIGWAGKAGQKAGLWDQSLGERAEGAVNSLTQDRGQNEFRDVNQSNFNLPGYEQSMGRHNALLDQLQAQAAGRGPSLADMQMQRGLQSALAQQQALAQSGRGNAAMAARQASINSGNIAQNLAGQGTMARLAEQRQGQQMLGGALQNQLALQQAQQAGTMGYEQQRGNNFYALTQTPTQAENKKNMLMDTLDYAAQAFGRK